MTSSPAPGATDEAPSSGGPLGFGTCLALVMATMVGTGVYTSLGFQLQDLHSGFSILLIWAAGGIISLCGSLCYAELSSRIPCSGGEYTYLTRAFHPAAGFMAGFVSLMAGFAAPIALAAIAFGTYLHAAFPAVPVKPAAVAAVILLSAGHLRSLEASARFQNGMTLLKFLLIGVFLLLGCWPALHHPSSLSALAPTPSSLDDLRHPGAGIALLFVLYAYSGWNAPTYLAGEVRNGRVTVGRSLAVGTLLVTLLYILTNAVFLTAAPASALKGKLDVGSIAAGYLLGPAGFFVMSCLIATGLLASLGAMILAGPRVTARIGEDHGALAFLSRRDRRGNPRRALLLQLSLVLLLIVTGSFETVLIYAQIPLLLCLILGVLAVVVLRRREPSFRGYLCPLYPLPPLLFILCTAAGLVYSAIMKPWVAFAGLLTMMVPLALHALISLTATSPRSTSP